MTLTADGWEINPDNKYFDLTPEIRKLHTLQEALKILEMNDNAEQNI
jgi:hypothetical protein